MVFSWSDLDPTFDRTCPDRRHLLNYTTSPKTFFTFLLPILDVPLIKLRVTYNRLILSTGPPLSTPTTHPYIKRRPNAVLLKHGNQQDTPLA